MYTILVDGKALYAPNLADEGYDVVSPKLTFELNKAGSLEFILPPNNVMYDQIQKLKSIVQVYDGSEEIFRGRVLHEERDFYRNKSVYCEGDLAFLLDSIQRVYNYQGTLDGLFRYYIDRHNSEVETTKKFVVGQITVTDKNNYVHYSSMQYPNTFDEINEKLIGTHGGYIRTRLQEGVRYIDYIEDYETVSPQIIEFGVNMLDISEYIKADDVFTVLIPLGAKQGSSERRLDIKSVNYGRDYILNRTAVDLFGHIWKTNTWDDVTLPENLLTKGQKYLENGIQMSVSLEMKAVDLHLINVDTQRIRLGDYVRVLSVPHHLDRLFQCTKVSLDLVDPKNSQYDFGLSFSSMTDMQVESNKGNSVLETAVITAQQTADQAKETADQASSDIQIVITEIDTGYVKTEAFESFKTEVDAKLSAVYHVKGSVQTYADLPAEGNTVGDVWNILDTGANYVWTETGWDKLSETIDLSAYALKTEIPTKVSDLTNDSGFIDQTTFDALEARVTALEQRGE